MTRSSATIEVDAVHVEERGRLEVGSLSHGYEAIAVEEGVEVEEALAD